MRNQFIEEEDTIFDILTSYKDLLEEKDYSSLEKFVMEFYKIMKSDKLFKSEILDSCRDE